MRLRAGGGVNNTEPTKTSRKDSPRRRSSAPAPRVREEAEMSSTEKDGGETEGEGG